MKPLSGRLIVAGAVPLLIVTGFWNWTRDQVRSQPVNTVPHQQIEAGFASPTVEVASLRRVSPAIVAWEEARSQAKDLGTAVSSLGETDCLTVTDGGITVVNETAPRRVSETARRLFDVLMALEVLGPDMVFATTLAGSEPVNGVVEGDLVLVGGGDPSLVSGSLSFLAVDSPWEPTNVDVLVDALVAAGVRRITGDIVGDGSVFIDEEPTPGELPSWAGLILDDGRILTSAQNRGVDTAQSAAKSLLDLLRSAGIAVEGSATTAVAAADVVPLAVVESEPLRVIARSLLRSGLTTDVWSVAFGNLESLIAVKYGDPGFPASGLSEVASAFNSEYGTGVALSAEGFELTCADIREMLVLMAERYPELTDEVIVGGVAATGVVISAGDDSIVAIETPLGNEAVGFGNLDTLTSAVDEVFDVIDRFSDERDPLAFGPEAVGSEL